MSKRKPTKVKKEEIKKLADYLSMAIMETLPMKEQVLRTLKDEILKARKESRKFPNATVIRKAMGVVSSTVSRNLKLLLEEGRVKMVGTGASVIFIPVDMLEECGIEV